MGKNSCTNVPNSSSLVDVDGGTERVFANVPAGVEDEDDDADDVDADADADPRAALGST